MGNVLAINVTQLTGVSCTLFCCDASRDRETLADCRCPKTDTKNSLHVLMSPLEPL